MFFKDLISQLRQNPKLAGWHSKLQQACEVFWDSLNANPRTEHAEQDVATLISLLSDRENFAVARLVVPELREMKIDPTILYHRQQRCVLEATSELRTGFGRVETARQSDFDDILYVAEKETMLNAELQRARVLLHQSDAFGSDNEQLIRHWLSEHPELRPTHNKRNE
ncbi:unnamed protein product [Zymoseptoria tritici ST99CH_3D1]|nr:unnamed protein product [Zymoseptoria tritici ST99CH_3D1]